MNTLELLSQKLEAFASAHGQIKSYLFSTRFKVDAVTQLYPMLVAMVKPSNIKNNSLQLTMDLLVIDILDGEEANLINVLSDSLSIVQDLVSWFGTWTGVGDFECRLDESSIYIEPLLHVFSNECAGYAVRATFIIPSYNNYCAVPWADGSTPNYPLN